MKWTQSTESVRHRDGRPPTSRSGDFASKYEVRRTNPILGPLTEIPFYICVLASMALALIQLIWPEDDHGLHRKVIGLLAFISVCIGTAFQSIDEYHISSLPYFDKLPLPGDIEDLPDERPYTLAHYAIELSKRFGQLASLLWIVTFANLARVGSLLTMVIPLFTALCMFAALHVVGTIHSLAQSPITVLSNISLGNRWPSRVAVHASVTAGCSIGAVFLGLEAYEAWLQTSAVVGSDLALIASGARFAVVVAVVAPVQIFLVVVALTTLREAVTISKLRWYRSRSEGRRQVQSAESGRFKVAHISDLHITDSDSANTIEGFPSPNPYLRKLFDHLCTVDTDVDVIVASGDITDAGTPGQWGTFVREVDRWSEKLASRIVLVPGNHDINIASASSHFAVDAPLSNHRHRRQLRFILAAYHMMGDRAQVVDPRGKLVSLREVVEELFVPIQDELDGTLPSVDIYWRGVRYGGVDGLFEQIFPMVVRTTLEPGRFTDVIVLNSNQRARSILTNALGYFGKAQMDRLDTVSKSPCWNEGGKVVAVHHHLTAPTELAAYVEKWKTMFMVVRDADRLLSSDSMRGAMVLFHGHRHIRRRVEIERKSIIGASSTTMSDVNPEATIDERTYTVHEIESRGPNNNFIVGEKLMIYSDGRG